MAYCYNCGSRVKPSDKKCPNCEIELEPKDYMCDSVEVEDIKCNIDFFLKWSMYVLYTSFILGTLTIIIGLFLLEESDGMSLSICLGGALLIANGYILENNLKWKAYQLLTNLKKVK